MNLILENMDQVKFFTNMKDIFHALKINCAEFDWYISDIETNGYTVIDGWYSGKTLKKIIEANEIQFIWAIFSAFEVGTRFDVSNKPYSDGNPEYWNGSNPKPQLEGAEFEIACWDSSAVILIGINSEQANNFSSEYTDAVELE